MAAKQVGFYAVAACVGLAATVALADPNGGPSVANPYGQANIAPGQYYLGAAGGVQWMTLPGWEYGVVDLRVPVESAFEIDGDGRLYGGQVWFGMGVDAGPGEHTRIQLEGSYAEGDFDGRQFQPPQSPVDTFVLLDGSGAPRGIADDSEATLDADVRGWEAGVRVLTDSLTNKSGALTQSLMIFGGAASQDYDADIITSFPCDPVCFDNFVRQDVDSWYVGVEAAVAGTVNLTPALTFTLGGRVAGLYFDANMDGEDCLDNTGGTRGCDGFATSEVSDGLEAVTYRGGGFVGVSYDFGGVSVGIMGTADYVPMADIVNPLTFVAAGGSPSHLDLSHELIYGGRGSIVIPFN